ncbi:MAG: TonB-dependent receptor [Verrucomicrobiota bacterium]
MARSRKPVKDRNSLVIALLLHVMLIGGVGYWAYKTGRLEQMRQAVLQYVRSEKKPEKKEEPIQQKLQAPLKLPAINQGMPQAPSSGSRRAVASDAPAAGDTFFQDTRRQTSGPSQTSTAPPPKQTQPPAPAPRIPAVLPALKGSQPSTIKQLLAERAKAAAATESFGAEQISRSGVSDAGAIVNKVAGATIVDGKFAVIRGLSDRYVTTTLNGAEIPSADPYRRSASLDLFPAQMIDKVVVAKTFTPEQQGAYIGGGINIVTKSFPARPFANGSVGFSINTQTSFNEEFLTFESGSLQWAGLDDGTRSWPETFTNPELVLPPNWSNSGRPTTADYEKRVMEADRLHTLTRELGVTQFAPHREAPGPNYNLSLAAGDTTHFLGKPLGIFLGANYRRDFGFYGDGRQQRVQEGGLVRSSFSDARASEVVNWAGMLNLAYQLHEYHEIGFNFLYNQNAETLARQQIGTNITDPASLFFANRLQFTERNLSTYQLKGTDTLPGLRGLRIDWLGALSATTQTEPDTRFFNYLETDRGEAQVGKSGVPEPTLPTRYYRNLDENNRNLKIDFTLPVRQWAWQEGELKAGFFDSGSDRTFFDRGIEYDGVAPFDGDPNRYLTPDNLGYTSRTNASRNILYTWQRYMRLRDSDYLAEAKVQAGYAMLDLPLADRVRLIGGVRYETTDLEVQSHSYLPIAATGKTDNESRIEQQDLLPAAGLVIGLRENMNLRVSYSETVARPSFRELAGYRSYDPVLDELLEGNPRLQMSSSANYDLRWEWFPRPGELISASLFYKELKNPIERKFVDLEGNIITYTNRPAATVLGFEFEARKALDILDARLRHFTLGGNLSIIQSETEISPEEFANKTRYVSDAQQQRPLYDQSPYILNVDLTYDNPHLGTIASLVFNVAGPRITIGGLSTEDVYQQPAPGLDFQWSQQLTPRLTARFSARNLLDPAVEHTYGENSSQLFSSHRRGMTFGLSLSCQF